MEFSGYLRPDELAGTRNLIGIISNGVCTSDAANRDHFHKYPDILDYLVDIDTTLTYLNQVGEELLDLIMEVASGRRTQNEIIGYVGTCDLWTIAPAA